MKLGRAALLAMLLAAGCYKATFIRDPSAVKGVERDQWLDFFVFGIVGEQNVEVRQFCPDGTPSSTTTSGTAA